MFWQEDEDKTLPYQAPDDVLDVSFSITCKQLPQDHAWTLNREIARILPWFDAEPLAAAHSIHVAESGNGWQRPEQDSAQLLIPSRRTRLSLRIPKQRLTDVQQLSGHTLDIDGYPLTVGTGKEKPLINASVIFARYVLSDQQEEENAFLQRMAQDIRKLTGVSVKKMMCGKSHAIGTPDGAQFTRHLMIADLDSEPSIRIQQYGLGGGRKFGCGLFLPHKGIKTLKPME
ncbi:MAG: type I-MYXAN CRISPR-associated protein Cas6/Cmx6 [Thiolinea sp.]